MEKIKPTAIIKLLGGCTKVANMVGTSVAAVSMWQNSHIPQDKLMFLAAELERQSHGLVTRKQLFPDTWHFIWPELK